MPRTVLSGLLLSLVVLAACGGDDDSGPLDVVYGEPTFIVVVNPGIDGHNADVVPAPGSVRAGITVSSDDGVSALTDVHGVAVLRSVASGARTLRFDGGAPLAIAIDDGELIEVAVSLAGAASAAMAERRYAFGGEVIDVVPTQSGAEVEAALAGSNRIVFFQEGHYPGDLRFTGSNVTLFGIGPLGGVVFLDGNVTVSGSDNRVRGAVVAGALALGASNASLGFSAVIGPTTVSGSDATLIMNDFCGGITVTGSGARSVGSALGC